MRFRRVLSIMFIGSLLSFLAIPTPASAVSIYHGKNPWSTVNGVVCGSSSTVVDGTEIVRGDTVYGTIYIVRSSRCNTVWAQVNFPGVMPAKAWGIAWITTSHGVRNCDSPGGSSHVLPGETVCRTPMVDYVHSVNDVKAQGHEYHLNSSGNWYIHATGTAYWPGPED